MKTLEIYLQGVQVSTYLERVRPAAKVLIELCSGGLATTLDRCIDFLQCGVPSTTWFYLCQNFLRRDLKRLGKMELSIHQTILEANRRTIRSTAAKQKGECLDLKTLAECFWGSKPPTRGPPWCIVSHGAQHPSSNDGSQQKNFPKHSSKTEGRVSPLEFSSKESDNPGCQFSRHSLDN